MPVSENIWLKANSCVFLCTHFRFETCGKIIIDKIPESIVGKSIQKKVEVRSKIQGEEVKILLASADGSFCQMLKPGSYVFKVGGISTAY